MDPIALRDLLIQWSEINSGSTNFPGLDRMRAALTTEFRALPHATVESIPLEGTPARALHVVIRPSAPLQVFLSGHYDTVYGAHHAFQKCTIIDADTLRGPGVADMKGGIVIMLAALREFAKTPHASQVGFEVLLTPDEETGSQASRAVLESIARSRMSDLALVFEPARPNGDLVRARKGAGIFTITCHGRAAHAGRDPAAGRNAILALIEYLPQAAELARDLDGVTVNIGNIRGGGAANIVPDFAEAQLNIRTSRLAEQREVVECLEALAEPINQREGYRLMISGGFSRPPKEMTPAEEQLFAAWRQCAAEVGVRLSWQDVGSGSDGNLLGVAGMHCLDGLGAVGDRLHTPDEFIRLSSLPERAAVAVRFFERLSTGDIRMPNR